MRLADRYVVVRKIGRGGAGEVYLARDELLGRDVAVKVLKPASRGSSDVERMRREARAAVALRHPNAVQVHDFVRGRGTPTFLVMEFLEGRTVREAVAEHGPFSPDMAARVGEQVLAALAAAHSLGIVHRDVKPDNVMLVQRARAEETPFAKVLDFGAVKLTSPADEVPKLTATNTVLGTWQYVAPEQIPGGRVDGRADVYSVGATLFFALTGLRPHQAADAECVTFAMSNAPTPPVRTVRFDVDEDLAAIVDRALAKDLGERWASAADMRVALRAWLARRVALGPLTVEQALRSSVTGTGGPRASGRVASDDGSDDVVTSLAPAVTRPEASEACRRGDRRDAPPAMTERIDLASRAAPISRRSDTLELGRAIARVATLRIVRAPAAWPATVANVAPIHTVHPARMALTSRTGGAALRTVLVFGGALLFALGLLGGAAVFP